MYDARIAQCPHYTISQIAIKDKYLPHFHISYIERSLELLPYIPYYGTIMEKPYAFS